MTKVAITFVPAIPALHTNQLHALLNRNWVDLPNNHESTFERLQKSCVELSMRMRRIEACVLCS